MSDPSVGGTATISGIVEGIDRLKEYLTGYKPDTKSVTYDYRNRTSEMTLTITVPDNRGRSVGKIKIPRKEGYELRNMFSTDDVTPVRASWDQTDEYWILDPGVLPANETYILRLDKQEVEADVFHEIVDLNVPEDPVTKSGVDQYWIQSVIKDAKTLADIYNEFQIKNIDLQVKVGVQRCFSTGLPTEVVERFERTRDLIRASNDGDRNRVMTSHVRRREARQRTGMTEAEMADLIRSFASPEQFGEFISVESPYRREEITPSTQEQAIFPEQVSVDLSTNLDLEQKAANGTLKFHKDEFTEHIQDETDDLL